MQRFTFGVGLETKTPMKRTKCMHRFTFGVLGACMHGGWLARMLTDFYGLKAGAVGP